jgi:hypothetical protein
MNQVRLILSVKNHRAARKILAAASVEAVLGESALVVRRAWTVFHAFKRYEQNVGNIINDSCFVCVPVYEHDICC